MRGFKKVNCLYICCLMAISMGLIAGCGHDTEKSASSDHVQKSETVKKPTDLKSEKKINDKLPVMKRTYNFYNASDFSFLKDQKKKYGLVEVSSDELKEKMKNKESFLLILFNEAQDYRLLFTDEYLKEKNVKAYFYQQPDNPSNYDLTANIERISDNNNKNLNIKNAMKYDINDDTLNNNVLTSVKNGVIETPVFNDYEGKTRTGTYDFEDTFSSDREDWAKQLNNWIKENAK
ncbi:hypothetical protein [Heyndrickxia ginsengihumi]|uniref:hypothetical protein n=1 Tax=Heyndrickxia ginsengihumi TaxID=363870 RepID=UPI0004707F10|nr:hypothetical protein [Heyndrickxia ginsengihumi]